MLCGCHPLVVKLSESDFSGQLMIASKVCRSFVNLPGITTRSEFLFTSAFTFSCVFTKGV
jgi:hypothetical protein